MIPDLDDIPPWLLRAPRNWIALYVERYCNVGAEGLYREWPREKYSWVLMQVVQAEAPRVLRRLG